MRLCLFIKHPLFISTERYLLRTLPAHKAQAHRKGRATTRRTVDSNFAAMFGDDLLGNRKPKAIALA